MNKTILKLTSTSGKVTEIEIPKDTLYMIIETATKDTTITTAIAAMKDGSIPVGSTQTTVSSDKSFYSLDMPTMRLAAGKKDEEGFVWKTVAEMYISDAGRILGKNITPGYASLPKPLATKPWTKRNITTNGYKLKGVEDATNIIAK